jgi:hypothetical protein
MDQFHASNAGETDDMTITQSDTPFCAPQDHHWELWDPTGRSGFGMYCWRCGADEMLSPEQHKAMAPDWPRQLAEKVATLKAIWGTWAALVAKRHPQTTRLFLIRPQPYAPARRLFCYDHPALPPVAFVLAEEIHTWEAWHQYLGRLCSDSALLRDGICLMIMAQGSHTNPRVSIGHPWVDTSANRNHGWRETIPTWNFHQPWHLYRPGEGTVSPNETRTWREGHDLIQLWPLVE